MKYIVSFFIIASIMNACKDREYPPTPNYLNEYLVADTLIVTSQDLWVKNDFNLYVSFDGDLLRDEASIHKYSRIFGDTCYNGPDDPVRARAYLLDTCQTMEVYCSSDFDLSHPEGTPLNDIVTIEYYWVYDYIKNGYQYTDIYFSESLSDFPGSPKVLMGDYLTLAIRNRPAKRGNYSFLIYFKKQNGEVLYTQTKEISY